MMVCRHVEGDNVAVALTQEGAQVVPSAVVTPVNDKNQ
jgi:hypothetical protein